MAAIAAFAVLSSGCSWFHQKADYYSKAPENRPLEVPPDLDQPVTTNELVVPPAGANAGSAARTTSAGASASSAPNAAPPAASVALSGSDLHVSDSVDHTYQRVGLALERAQVGTISARDEATRTYTVDVNSTVQVEGEHHWYSRVLHPFSGGNTTQQVTGRLTVRVSDDAGGSRVSVEGNAADKGTADAARRVLDVLRDRLS
ncbi:MAG TPA: hypothetical protein VF132_06640 [Rudaea sp.]